MAERVIFKWSRAQSGYICADCGSIITAGTLYLRVAPHPLARYHRGLDTVRQLCKVCGSKQAPLWYPPAHKRDHPGQLTLPFEEVVAQMPSLLLQVALVSLGDKLDEGHVVQGVTIPWFEIIDQIAHDPEFLIKVPWWRLEELIAGAYEREGWSRVILTPRSGDQGRDIIAERPGICAIRIIDQVKAYSPGRRVSADEVRAMLGVLAADPNVSKGFVTTTARFAPGIFADEGIMRFVPYRLDLKDGQKLRTWLVETWRGRKKSSNEGMHPAAQKPGGG